MISKPALFLDRDGVVNKYGAYIHKIKDFEFNKGIFKLCSDFKIAGFKIIIITNQAGVARNIFTEEDFYKLNEFMLIKFKENGVNIDDVYKCFCHPDYSQGSCECRKPNPGMILDAIKKHKIDPLKSILIGDSKSDVEAGKKANVKHNFLIQRNILPTYKSLIDQINDA